MIGARTRIHTGAYITGDVIIGEDVFVGPEACTANDRKILAEENNLEHGMKLGFISYDFYPPIGGQGVVSYNLYEGLSSKDDLDITVFSSRENDFINHVRIPVGRHSGLGPLLFSLKASLKIRKLVKKYKLDLLRIDGGPGGVFLLRNPGVPVIYVSHHTYAQQQRYLGRFVYKILMKMERRGYTLAGMISADSTTTKTSLVNDYGISPEKVVVISNGVDLSCFKPSEVKEVPNSVLFVGRLCPRKGINLLIESISLVMKEIPDIRLYIIGDGELMAELKRFTSENDLEDNVFFLGEVSQEDLVEWYNKSTVFVLPSLFEGFGLVCLEAMACGTPVIATKVPGVVDIIDSNVNGILVPRDRNRLADAIIQVLEDSALRDSLGEAARKKVLEDFNWQAITDKFAGLIADEHERGVNDVECR
ncbi:MAG: glycosyltransferase [Actinomycetia bacterium]|nr:glycosyltransferase [Actinomycetes bacterium]